MRRLPTPLRRAPVAVGLLVVATGGALADALAGGRSIDTTPVFTIASAVAGFLVGAWLSPVLASVCCLAGAAVLTAANQLTGVEHYSVPNDLFFFAVLLGGTALVGAVVTGRREQVRELRRLTRIRQQQRVAQLRASGLEERSRISTGVVTSLVQRLGALVVQSSGTARDVAGPQTAAALARIEETAREALDELRDVVGTLRQPDPAADEDARPPGSDVGSGAAPVTRVSPPSWADLLAAASGLPLAFESVASSAAHGPALANAVAGVAVGLPLIWRRRRPVLAVTGMSVVATLMSAWLTPLPVTVSVLLPISLAAYALGSDARRRARPAGLAVLVGGMGATVLVSPRGSADPSGIAPTLVWLGLAYVAGVVAAQHARRATELRRLLERIEADRHQELRLVVAEQRTRTARELHDSVAHAMTVVCLQAEAARHHPHDVELRRSCVATIEATARGAMAELRRGLVELDTETSGAVTGRDLAVDVARVAASLGVDTEVRFAPDTMTLPAASAEVVRRVVREALVNAARHAPGARVRVRCEMSGSGLEVEVRDDGTGRGGFALGSGTGLHGLGELLTSAGGHLEHGPTAHGFRVAAHLPSRVQVLA